MSEHHEEGPRKWVDPKSGREYLLDAHGYVMPTLPPAQPKPKGDGGEAWGTFLGGMVGAGFGMFFSLPASCLGHLASGGMTQFSGGGHSPTYWIIFLSCVIVGAVIGHGNQK